MCIPHLPTIVPAVLPALQDLSMRVRTRIFKICLSFFILMCDFVVYCNDEQVKQTAERALKRMFGVRNGDVRSAVLTAFSVSPACTPELDRRLKEIVRKQLSVLPEQSDDEDTGTGVIMLDNRW